MNLANQFAQPLELMNAQVEKQLVDMVLCLVKRLAARIVFCVCSSGIIITVIIKFRSPRASGYVIN